MTLSADAYHIMKTGVFLASLHDMELDYGIGSDFVGDIRSLLTFENKKIFLGLLTFY